MAISQEGLERIEAFGLKPEQLPRHVAVIMDGNGRWAQRRRLLRVMGHRTRHSERACGGRGGMQAGA